jgi:hypothetical protein
MSNGRREKPLVVSLSLDRLGMSATSSGRAGSRVAFEAAIFSTQLGGNS